MKKDEILIFNKKDNKLWKFIVEEDIFKIEIGADLTYRNIYVFEIYCAINKINLKEIKEKIEQNNNIFFMKMNFDNFRLYDKELNFLKLTRIRLINFVA